MIYWSNAIDYSDDDDWGDEGNAFYRQGRVCHKDNDSIRYEIDFVGENNPKTFERMSTKAQLQHLKSQAEEMKDAKTLVGRAEYHFRMHRYLAFKQATLRTEPSPPTDAEQEAMNALVADVGLDGPINVKALNKAQRIANKVKAGAVDKKEAKYIIENERYDDVASDSESDSEKEAAAVENPSA